MEVRGVAKVVSLYGVDPALALTLPKAEQRLFVRYLPPRMLRPRLYMNGEESQTV
jgi:hypothetical protein